MASNMKPEDIERLKSFVEACKLCPKLLLLPELSFFREFIESLGGKLPSEEPPSEKMEQDTAEEAPEKSPTPEPESEESDIELDTEGVIEPESREPPEMGDSSKVVTEEDMSSAGDKREEAMAAASEGDLDKAIDLFTEAIKINPTSAMMYAKRASMLLKQDRVKAALKDCDEALTLNPDSATAYKFRGRAHRLLGNWILAAKDLRLACKLDFDEQADEWLKEVQPNATRFEEHKRKYERKKEEKLINERRERIKKAQEQAKAQQSQRPPSESDKEEMPNINIPEFLKDPELVAAMEDPEVAQAFRDVTSNPANILKYQNNPKVSAVINKLLKNMGGGVGSSGFPGGFPGGDASSGGFPGGDFPPGGFPGFPPQSADDDLD